VKNSCEYGDEPSASDAKELLISHMTFAVTSPIS
jgi:hypothetical protein